jgi:hypothetical protein
MEKLLNGISINPQRQGGVNVNAEALGLITPYADNEQVRELFKGYVWFATSEMWVRLFRGVKWHDEMPISYPRGMKAGSEVPYEEWLSNSKPPIPNTVRLYLIYKLKIIKGKGIMMWFYDPDNGVRVRVFLTDREVIKGLPFLPGVGEALYYVRGVFSDGFIVARSPISSLVYMMYRKRTFVIGARFRVNKEARALVR